MKVIGIKFKGRGGKVTHSQYVRVNLVDFEHPFFSRVWHGVSPACVRYNIIYA